jgi:lysozyme family protein
MVTPFDRAMAIVFEHEGGVSSDRKDTAGDGTGRPHTNLGVTLKAVRALDADGRLGRFLHEGFDVDDDGDIDEADVPGWTRETAAEFYRRFYWQEA